MKILLIALLFTFSAISVLGQQKNPPLPYSAPAGYVEQLERREAEARRDEQIRTTDYAKESRETFLQEREAARQAAIAQSESEGRYNMYSTASPADLEIYGLHREIERLQNSYRYSQPLYLPLYFPSFHRYYRR